MTKTRLEAFSDAVIAVIITIMVLELKPPHGTDLENLQPILPTLLCYILSFIYVGIYWNNHHHLLHAVHKVNGPILWANLHLLFWLSLVPFATSWMGENTLSYLPVALYGFILIMNACAYTILTKVLISQNGKDSHLAKAVGDDRKGKISLLLYALGLGVSFLFPMIAVALYILVACIWLVPDRRIEKILT